VQIKEVRLKNFRCFEEYKLNFDDSKINVIEGPNGSGKTSILEALNYACFMRSFRTHKPKELLKFESDNFFIEIKGVSAIDADEWTLSVALSKGKKKVKLNGKNISTYREIFDFYRVITMNEDDIMLVKGSPELRRNFLDQAILLTKPEFSQTLREYKKVLKQRNSLLYKGVVDKISYDVWTEKLRELTDLIRKERLSLMTRLEKVSNELIADFFNEEKLITLDYKTREESNLYEKECLMRRTLFGAHLDDFNLFYKNVGSKKFSSRGQQKLVVMALKIAQLKILNKPVVFLIDDFISDFDEEKLNSFIELLKSTGSQLIFTTPIKNLIFFEDYKKVHISEIYA